MNFQYIYNRCILLVAGVIPYFFIWSQQRSDTVYYSRSFSIDSLIQQQYTEGYIDAEWRRMNDSTFSISGLDNPIRSIHIALPSSGRKKDTCRAPVRLLKDCLYRVLLRYSDEGFPFARIRLQDIARRDSILIARAGVDTFRRRFVDTIIIKGYERYPTALLSQLTGVYRGDVLNLSLLHEAPERIIRSGTISSIRPPEILFTKDSTYVFYYLKKIKGNRFDGLLGFKISPEEKRKLVLSGNIHVALNNIFDHGESLRLNWIPGELISKLSLEYRQPYIARTPLWASGSLKIERIDSSALNFRTGVSTGYLLDRHWKIGGVWQYQQFSDNTDAGTGFDTHRFGINVSFDRKSSGKWQWGFYQMLTLGNRLGERQWESASQYRFSYAFRNHKILDLQLEAAYLFSEQYYPNELLKTGGAYSIRGFPEDYFAGKYFFLARPSYRYRPSRTHEFSLFADTGYISPPYGNAVTAFAPGIGYGYEVKNGEIHIEWAAGMTAAEGLHWHASRLHIRYSGKF